MLVSEVGTKPDSEGREGRSEGQLGAMAVVSLDSTEKLNRQKVPEAHRIRVGTILKGGGGRFLSVSKDLP